MVSRTEGALDAPMAQAGGMATKDIEDWVLEASDYSPLQMKESSVVSVPGDLPDSLDLSRLAQSDKNQAESILMGLAPCFVGTSSGEQKETAPSIHSAGKGECLSETESREVVFEGRQKLQLKNQQTRSNAINLIRSRTLTRLSPAEPTSTGVTLSLLSDQIRTSNAQFANPDLGPVVVMQPVHASKKKKKKRASKSKQPRKNSNASLAKDPASSQNETELLQTPQSEADANMSTTQSPSKEGPQQEQSSALSDLSNAENNLKVSDSALSPAEPKQSGSESLQLSSAVDKTPTGSLDSAEKLGSSVSPVKGKAATNAESPPVASSASASSSPQRVSSSQSSRKPASPAKERLPPIEEVEPTPSSQSANVPAGEVKKESSSAKAKSWAAIAARGLGKLSWEPDVVQEPQSDTKEKAEPTSIDTPNKGKRPQQTADPQDREPPKPISNHAHPSPVTARTEPTQSTPRTRAIATSRKPEGFFWQLDSHGFPCAKNQCEKRCNLWDGSTVICPKCGPYSEVRYCSKKHLHEDIKWHWLYCGDRTFTHPCRENSIPQAVRNGPPLVPCLHPYDTPERHRQAVFFNTMAREGDYFVFSDHQDWARAGYPESDLETRCSHRFLYTVKNEDPEMKDRFRRVLAACLFMTIEVHELADYLFRLIRDNLRAQGVWSPQVQAMLKLQIHSELAINVLQEITGERHACETDWNGKNRRNCQDAVCRGEFRRLLGSVGGKGHCQLLDHLEGTFWILRAARTTHPEVTDPKARMQGEGFEGVADEDRRVFQRGEGWDGAGTGPMEMEGINA